MGCSTPVTIGTLEVEQLMRIGVDASWAVNERAGVGRYSYELLRALPQVIGRQDQLELVAGYLNGVAEKDRRLATLSARQVSTVHTWLPGGIKERLFAQKRFNPLGLFFSEPLDLYHAHTVQAFPVVHTVGPIARVVTIHDLSYIHYPDHLGQSVSQQFKALTHQAVRLADLIICDSEATKEDLVKLVGAAKARCRVVLLGIDDRFSHRPADRTIQAVIRRYKLPKEFVLFVGTVEPRKNLARLITAYLALPEATIKQYPLVISGGLGWRYDDVLQALSTVNCQMSNLQDQPIRYLGFVPDEDLPALYRLATIFAYPSLLEGFGLPPLEAMASGLPVLTSNCSSLPEVVGEAAVMVTPTDERSITHGLYRLLTDSRLRKKLAKSGRTRSKKFTLRRMAEETYRVYQEAVAGRN